MVAPVSRDEALARITAATEAFSSGGGDATAANQTTIIGHVDGIETLLTKASTGTVTSVADSATSGTLLSSSATRKGFRIVNDSDQTLYVKYGTTATTTDYTVKMEPYATLFEDSYYGRVDGIWAANSTGSARITDLT